MGMTKECARKLLPIMQAYAAGKKIQLRTGDHWHDLPDDDVSFTFDAADYRVKPEPQLRPFTLQEYLAGYADHYSRRLIAKKGDPSVAFAVVEAHTAYVVTCSGLCIAWSRLTDKFTWHDGTEIGIIDE